MRLREFKLKIVLIWFPRNEALGPKGRQVGKRGERGEEDEALSSHIVAVQRPNPYHRPFPVRLKRATKGV